ncbi:serine/threonine-protein kinase [Streptomyces sp. C6-003]
MHERAVSRGGGRTETLPRGHRIGGWIVGEQIGAGGWSTVYAARRADRPGAASAGAVTAAAVGAPDREAAGEAPGEVALKVMPTAGLAPRQARAVAEAARHEVELARRAPHPRLVRLLDSVVLSTPDRPSLDGAIVLVMERAAGSLRDLLDTGITEAEGHRIVAGVCEGLAHLHRSGWVHTDLKPENILIGQDGEVRLSDFGLAIELSGTHGYAAPMGTLDYLPPERWKEPLGERGVRVRPTTDIWALGIVIHEVFAAGVAPFPGATPAARGAAVQEYAGGRASLRMDHAVPEFWRALVADCLAPTHAARAPHTAVSLLRRISAHEAAGPGPARRTRQPGPRRRTALVALAGCAVAGSAVAAGAALGSYGGAGGAGEEAARIRVFNAELGCRDRQGRELRCSLGLAIDPLLPYTAENVVATRVWHGDTLDALCRLPDGQLITDEADVRSTVWFRVRVPGADAPATAWLPAVRTEDRPDLPRCTLPAGSTDASPAEGSR